MPDLTDRLDGVEVQVRILPLYLLAGAVFGQTLVDLRNQGRNIDFSTAISTRPEKTGTVLPATCNAGELFFNTAAPSGANLFGCVAPNTWAGLGGSGGAGGPGVCNAANTSSPNTLSCTIPGFVVGTGAMLTLFVSVPNTSSTVTLAVNGGSASAIFRGSGSSPSVGELAPNSTPLLLSFTGSAYQIVDDAYEAGGSNCLAFSRTTYPWTIDINPACSPQLASANAWTGYNNFSGALIRLPESTIGTLPAASSNLGKEFIVTDGTSAVDCSTGGGGTVVNMCRSNGTSWVYLGSSGSILNDAGGAGYGSWPPFGIGASASNFTYGAGGTTYFIEISGVPLMTVNSVVMQDTGPAGTHFWAFALYRADGGGGCNLVASTGGLPFTSGNFDTNTFLSAYQLQPSGTYYAAWSSDTSAGTHQAVVGSEQLFNPDNGGGSNPFRFFTGNSTVWAAGNPTFPSTCGTRTKYTGNIPLIVLRHN
jgi:hypothetical protein